MTAAREALAHVLEVEDVLPACEITKCSTHSFTFGFILLPFLHSVPVFLGISAALTLYHFGVLSIKPDPLSAAVFPMHKGKELKNQGFTQTNLSLGRRASPGSVIYTCSSTRHFKAEC